MPVLLLLLIALAAELAVIIAIGQAVGALVTILLLIGMSVLGMSLLRRQGLRTITALSDGFRERRDVGAEVTDGALLAVAAGLVLFPGFLSDVAALVLVFPPTRGVVRRRLMRRRRRAEGVVVDGEVVRDEDVIVIEARED